MAQISKGTTYSDGMLVTSANLNAHVDNATLTGGAISDQTAAGSVTTSDLLLLNQGSGVGTLKKATVAQVLGTQSLSGYVKADGSVAMTGNLTLPATAPSSTQAVSRAWVEGYVSAGTLGYTPVNKAGDTMTGDLTMSGSSTVVLARNPSANLESAPKQYVDTAVSTLATQSALTAHTGNTSNPHSVTAAQVGLGNVNNTSDVAKPVSTAQQAALDLKLNISGGTLTGPLGLPAGDPPASNSATSKAYVDAGLANKVNTSGGTLSGSFVYTSTLQRTTTPTVANDVVNKSYVDAIPKVIAKAWFQTNLAPTTTTSTSRYLTVTGVRISGSSTLTINYSGLASGYKDASQPFFLAGQYIGVVAATGLTGKLYKIQSTDFANKTFTITTTETTTFAANVTLSLVVDSVAIPDSTHLNIKSIYWNPSAPSKYYVNFLSDTSTGSKTNESPSYVWTAIVCGQGALASASSSNFTSAVLCFDIAGRTTYIDSVNSLEGFGATTMGCHVGYFYAYNGGANTALWNATLAITY